VYGDAAVARSEVTFVDAINVNGNKVVNLFSANDRVLIKLLKQKKRVLLKSLSRNFPANRGQCQD